MRLAPVIYCYNQLIFITDKPITASDVRTRKKPNATEEECLEISNTFSSFEERVTLFDNQTRSLCREVNAVKIFSEFEKPHEEAQFLQILCSARMVETVVFTTNKNRPNSCRSIPNSDRIIYYDAEAVASFYAVSAYHISGFFFRLKQAYAACVRIAKCPEICNSKQYVLELLKNNV